MIEAPDDERPVEVSVFRVEFQAQPELEEEASIYDVAILSSHRLLLAAEGEQNIDDFEPAFWRVQGDTWLPKPGVDAGDSEEEDDVELRYTDVGDVVSKILEDTLSSPMWQKRFE